MKDGHSHYDITQWSMKCIYLSVLEPEVAMIGGVGAPLKFGSPESESRKVEKKMGALFCLFII